MTGRAKKLEILRRRDAVAKRYMNGQTLQTIAESLEVAIGTVFNDLKAIRESWMENAQAAISEHKARELAKLDNLEMRAWQAFELSQGDVLITTERGRGKSPSAGHGVIPPPTEVTRQQVRRKSAGDPRFMKIILDCITKRCAIFGLAVGTPTAGNDNLPVIGFEVVQPTVIEEEAEEGSSDVNDNAQEASA